MTATTVERLCRECAALGKQTVSVELDRFPRLDLVEFQCLSALKHLEFDRVDPRPKRPHRRAA